MTKINTNDKIRQREKYELTNKNENNLVNDNVDEIIKVISKMKNKIRINNNNTSIDSSEEFTSMLFKE